MKSDRIIGAGSKIIYIKSIITISIFIFVLSIMPGVVLQALGQDISELKDGVLLNRSSYFGNNALSKNQSFSEHLYADNGLMAKTDSTIGLPGKPKGYYGTKDWQVFIGIYMWVTSINGESGIGEFIADVDMSFGDILDTVDIGGQAHIELWWKRWIFFVDPTYAVLNSDDSETRLIGTLKSDLKTQFFMLDMGAGYRVATIPLSQGVQSDSNKNSWPSVAVDLYGGGRILSLDTRLKLTLDTNLGPSNVRFQDHNTWFDFLVGTRLFFKFTENFGLTTKTDIGGFGLSFSSDISWNLDTRFGYTLPWWGVTPYLGYRVLYIDYTDGTGDEKFVYKMWQTGPMLGIGITF